MVMVSKIDSLDWVSLDRFKAANFQVAVGISRSLQTFSHTSQPRQSIPHQSLLASRLLTCAADANCGLPCLLHLSPDRMFSSFRDPSRKDIGGQTPTKN